MRPFGILAVVVALAATAAPAGADAGVDTRDVAPIARVDSSGDAVAVGDVNGDGIGDLGLGPFSERAEGRRCEPLDEEIDAGDTRNWQDAAEIVFGGPSPGPFARDAVGPNALRVRCFALPQLEDRGPPGSGVSYGGRAGGAVAGAGDVNGDGLADVAVGAPGAGPRGRPVAGSVHVVFGAREGGELDARSLGARGVRIDGPQRASGLGVAIVPVGDVDGDGHDDLALPYRVGIAAPNGRRLNRERLRVAIVFGGFSGGEQVDLAAPGDRATVLTGVAPGYEAEVAEEVSLAGLGDVDGDGGGEVAVGSPHVGDFVLGTGRVVVLNLRRRGATVEVSRETPVMAVRAGRGGSVLGTVAPAGDVDGDGRQDLAVSAALATGVLGLRSASAAVLVVPSRPGTTVELARPPEGVRTILGGLDGDGFDVPFTFGSAIAPLGDVDADGRPDLLIGQRGATPDCRTRAGSAWVVPGAAGGGTTPVARVPGAWRIDGARPSAAVGARASAGDLTGDGVPELVLPALPFDNAAVDDVRIIAAQRPLTTVGPLTSLERCFGTRLLTRTLRGLRSGRVAVHVRSNMGTGQRQTLAIRVTVGTLRSRPRTRRAIDLLEESILRSGVSTRRVRFAGPARRRIVVRLTPRTRRMLRVARFVAVSVEVEQVSPNGATATHELTLAR